MEPLAAIRQRLGLTQKACAERLGIDQSTVSRIETGELEPSVPVRKLIEMLLASAPAPDRTNQEMKSASNGLPRGGAP